MTPQLAAKSIDNKVVGRLDILFEYERPPSEMDIAALCEPGGGVYNALLEHHFIDAERTALVPFDINPPKIGQKKNGDYLVKFKVIVRGYPVH